MAQSLWGLSPRKFKEVERGARDVGVMEGFIALRTLVAETKASIRLTTASFAGRHAEARTASTAHFYRVPDGHAGSAVRT
jgi:hypothetical protein